MKRLLLDLSKGLDLTHSEGSSPFSISRLNLIPLPGRNFAPHPGHDVIQGQPDILAGIERFAYTDTSGVLILRKRDTTWVANPSTGRYKSIGIPHTEGAFITGLGLYRDRQSYAFLQDIASPVFLKAPSIINGDLSAGRYVLWALSFSRTLSGLFLTWYNMFPVQVPDKKGVRIELTENPGRDRVVHLYVQRSTAAGYGKLTFLAVLTGEQAQFEYVSHLQEGETVELAITRGIGGLGAYWNGRHVYQAAKLSVLGLNTVSGSGGQCSPARYGYGLVNHKDARIGFGDVAANSQPTTFTPALPWKASVRTSKGLFAAVVDGDKFRILHTDSPDLWAWSVVYETDSSNAPPEPIVAAANQSVVVFLGGSKAIVGDLSSYDNPGAWDVVTTPATEVQGLVWSGSQFGASVNAPVRGIMTSSDGRTWTLTGAPAGYQEYSFHDIISIGGLFVIQGRKQLSDGYYVDYFTYTGGSWDKKFIEEKRELTLWGQRFVVNVQGVVRRRYTAMFTTRVDSEDYVVISYGVKAGSYWIGSLSWTDLPESDYVAVYRASDFLRNEPVAFYYIQPPAHNDHTPYVRAAVIPERATILFRSPSAGDFAYALDYYCGWQVSRISITGAYGGTSSDSNLAVLYPYSTWGFIRPSCGGYSYTTTTLHGAVQPPCRHAPPGVVYTASSSRLHIYKAYQCGTQTLFRGQSIALPPGTGGRAVTSIWGDNAHIALAIITTNTAEVWLTSATNPASYVRLASLAASSQAGTQYTILGIWNGRLYGYFNGKYWAHPLDGSAQHEEFAVNAQYPGAASDGTSVFVIGGDRIYKWGDTAPTYTASGNITAIWSGSDNKLYFAVGTELYELNTASSPATAQLITTLPSGAPLYGVYDGTRHLVAVQTSSAYPNHAYDLYLVENGSHQLIHSGAQGYVLPLPETQTSSSQAPASETSTGSVEFEANTIVWTLPGYVNLTTPHSWHKVTSRTSRQINEIIAHPSGALIAMDNEVYVLSGRLTSVSDTRFAPYPVPIGLDQGVRVSQAGSTVFMIWGGKIYAMGDGGATLVSYQVDDGVPFVGVAYDPKTATLFALKKDGRVLAYDTVRKLWYNELDGVTDVAHYYDGASGESTVAFVKNGRLYRRYNGRTDPTDNFIPSKPLVVLSAVKMGEEDIKRLRGVLIELRSEGPPGPNIKVYNEAGLEVLNMPMAETLQSNSFGLGRYRAFFPPVFYRMLDRLEISFTGYKFSLADKIEVRYEGVSRRA